MLRPTETFELRIEALHLHYHRWGQGNKILLALHGYALDGLCFREFASIEAEYTVYSFDLPYHGKSAWNYHQPLPPSLWNKAVQLWKSTHGINRYDILGFSMGGKFALCTLDNDAAHIDKLLLIAPDGIRKNFWYSTATNNPVSRLLFRKIAMQEGYFERFANYLHKVKVIPEMTLKFAKTQMGGKRQRNMAFLVWTNFRLFYGPLKKRIQLITKHTIQVKLYTGRHDRVIQRNDVQGISKLPPTLFHWHELDCGHTGILKKVSELKLL